MTRYISLDALIAEIERIKDEEIGIGLNAYEMGEENGKAEMCDKFLSFLNSLEVREVDINKEIEKELDSKRWKCEYIDTKKFRESAKHFFELGMCIRQVLPRFYKTSRFEKEVDDEPECKIIPRPIECDSTCKECPWLATNNKAQKGE